MRKIQITQDDYLLMTNFLETNGDNLSGYAFSKLTRELRDAEVLDSETPPEHVIGLNSEVELMSMDSKQKMKIKLVLPKDADPKIFNVSLFAPIGTALIGNRQDDTVEWEVGGKLRKFKVINVKNYIVQ